MTTIVNNPPPQSDSGGSMGMIVGLLLIVILGVLFFVYGLPAIRRMTVPQITPQINIPSKIDINVNQQGQ